VISADLSIIFIVPSPRRMGLILTEVITSECAKLVKYIWVMPFLPQLTYIYQVIAHIPIITILRFFCLPCVSIYHTVLTTETLLLPA